MTPHSWVLFDLSDPYGLKAWACPGCGHVCESESLPGEEGGFSVSYSSLVSAPGSFNSDYVLVPPSGEKLPADCEDALVLKIMSS